MMRQGPGLVFCMSMSNCILLNMIALAYLIYVFFRHGTGYLTVRLLPIQMRVAARLSFLEFRTLNPPLCGNIT